MAHKETAFHSNKDMWTDSPHLAENGECNCDCAECSTFDDTFDATVICICPDCNAEVCDVHE